MTAFKIRMCSFSRNIPSRFAEVYNSAACNIQRADDIGMLNATGKTLEDVLLTLPPQTADRAGLTGISRIDKFNNKARSFRLNWRIK